MKTAEILNALEQMVETFYEVSADEVIYYEEVIGNAMDILLEVDEQWAEKTILQSPKY